MHKRRLDQATFQALQALIARGYLGVSEQLAEAIRQRRRDIGATVEALTAHFGVGADELEGIEQGGGKISAPTLVKLAEALNVDLVWFIEREPSLLPAPESAPVDFEAQFLDAQEALELIKVFAAIKDASARKAVLKLARQFASEEGPDDDPSDKKGDD